MNMFCNHVDLICNNNNLGRSGLIRGFTVFLFTPLFLNKTKLTVFEWYLVNRERQIYSRLLKSLPRSIQNGGKIAML